MVSMFEIYLVTDGPYEIGSNILGGFIDRESAERYVQNVGIQIHEDSLTVMCPIITKCMAIHPHVDIETGKSCYDLIKLC